MESILTLENLSKDFGRNKILQNITMKVKEGEIVCVIGPSGAGKTTLMKVIAGLEKPSNGTVRLHNMVIEKPTKDIGMVFQQFNLWPHKTVLENIIEAPTLVNKLSKQNAMERAYHHLEKLNLTNKAREYLHTLSGGEQQRVAILRSLAMEPKILLLDEVTAALDPELVGEVLGTIKKLAQERRTMIIVTHHIEFARDIAHRILFLDNGVIVEEGNPEEILTHPKEERTKQFLQNILFK